jgi:acyl-CoA reductase-like NAD-dependent aldehyde dehydrogenase
MMRLDVLRQGVAYRSMETLPVPHVCTGETVAELGYANAGLIRRDARQFAKAKATLDALDTETLLGRIEAAGVLFAEAELSVGDQIQGPQDYIRSVSATTGIPEVLCAKNVEKIRAACAQVRASLSGLTGGIEPGAFDTGLTATGDPVQTDAHGLGAVLPSNAPGVHALWIPVIAMKIPVALKPGGSEPWTPYRLAAALSQAGVPKEAVSIYPTDHSGGEAILAHHDRGMVFGQTATVAPYVGNPAISIHGPGYSKIWVGEDQIDEIESHIDLIVESVLDNAGRSCINASTLMVPRGGRDIAHAIAERLGAVKARPLDDPAAALAAFSSRAGAEQMWAHIHELAHDGVVDCTASFGSQVQESDGLYFMRPTVLWCPDNAHPLARTEYPFPFVSVVEVSEESVATWVGDTLVLSALTDNPRVRHACSESPLIDRLYMGGEKTTVVDWSRPYQGNLFELLYQRSRGSV